MIDCIIAILYLVIGLFVASKYWQARFKREYEAAKASEEGVEEGMVGVLLLCITAFWPLILIIKGIKKCYAYSKVIYKNKNI
jgi:hypothetical protein